MKIEDEIQQPVFKTEYHKAQVNILFTASWLNQRSMRVLKPFKISAQQFNILRILRGMHPEPATVKVLTERMIDKMSNASRLVDKLLSKGLVDRRICTMDRRRVDIVITEKGMQVINEASLAMEKDVEHSLVNLTTEEAALLNNFLDRMRE